MKDLVTLLKIIVRENLTPKPYNDRINEPTMAMTFEEQITAFSFGSSVAGPLASIQCFAAYNASRAIRDAKRVLDLGCGTGHVLTKMAFINPDKYFFALDLSPGMLEEAKKLAHSMGLSNIEFHLGDMTDLSRFENQNIDAVTSSLALHHLRSSEDLIKAFKGIKKVLPTNGQFSFLDLGKLKFKKSIQDIISLHNHNLPVLKEETINSYLASFSKEEFYNALNAGGLNERAKLSTTLFVPLFIKINTSLKKLTNDQEKRLYEIIGQLSVQNQFLFKVLRFYFLT